MKLPPKLSLIYAFEQPFFNLVLKHKSGTQVRSKFLIYIIFKNNPAMPKDRPTIKDDEKYEKLKEQGMSKQKAARIANTPDASKKGGRAKDMDERSVKELKSQAKKVGIEGYSKMKKSELISALRRGAED